MKHMWFDPSCHTTLAKSNGNNKMNSEEDLNTLGKIRMTKC